MLLMVEKGTRGGICHAIHRYAKANNKDMKNYDKHKESSYIQYLDANNLYGWEMSQKLFVDGFKWKKNMLKFNEDFIKNYDEDSDKGYILEADVEYPKNFHDLHSDLPFLPERMKINKCNKLVCNLCDKEKEKEIYNKLTEESFEKINNLDKKVDTNKLLFKYKGNTPDEDFSKFNNALNLINKIRDGEISFSEAKDEQTKLISDIGEIKRVQKETLIKRE